MNDALEKLFYKKGAIKKIGVVGMGYVGIPSAVLFADSDVFNFVWGFQRDSSSSGYKIPMLNRGECPLRGEEPGLPELLRDVVHRKKFMCTPDFSHIAGVDAVTLAIQTPFTNRQDLEPDFTSLRGALGEVGQNITPGTLVVLESTITPGTTTGMAREILEKESGLLAGEDFGLAHAPERVMVGRLLRNIREHDRCVGGINDTSTKRACELYSPLLHSGKIIPMTATAAEVTKTAENTLRDLQIAAINQLAIYCEILGVSVYEVRAGIDSLKGEGISRAVLYPGAGVGGHCLTKDTYHLERGVRNLGHSSSITEIHQSLFTLARHINDFMPRHMMNLTSDGLKAAGKSLYGSRIALLGWAFIRNSDDSRNTPSEFFYTLCQEKGAIIAIHDPYVEKYPGVEILSDLSTVLHNTDAIAIFTGHGCYEDLNPAKVRELCGSEHPVIIDGRNIVNPDRFIAEGFVYRGIGRGDKNHAE